MLSVTYLFFAPILFSVVTTMYSSKSLEGYPAGYLADCPGSEQPTTITNKSLKYLTFTVLGINAPPKSSRLRYSYYQMKELSDEPTMDYSKKTMLYVGGFLDSPNYPFATALETNYRRLGYNVLLVDMNKFFKVEYPVTARLMRAVGKHIGEMLSNLTNYNMEFDPKKLEIVGLSLGGQTMSYVAKTYKALTGSTIARLTALDPSGPCFRNLGPEDRLDRSDADFVDVVATNIDGFGMAAPVGHVNFYVNGGEYQPGDIFWLPCNIFCSHIRAYTLWFSALQNPDSFIAMQCDSVQQARERNCYDRQPLVTNLLGLNVDKTKQGVFYLATSYGFPYYMGEKGLKRKYEIFSTMLKSMNSKLVMTI
ncbi:pancreatic lipase-related protein 2-like isoform X2 [Galleria mellonella]|uniref:Pancreatic lipase-related protein 2-like isoform X2 n=1 Tax=Galleria mellonella TaxID=7137 RepID=A0ABM3N5P1_GALME|nr:pancreatic lipase-related protein 2-like isoform X2 [Galleria mellonella]